MADEMDIMPHQMVRHAVLGHTERLVNSKSLWLCLNCHTCGARCPNGIDVPALLDPIRHDVIKKKIKTQDPNVPAFHEIFVQTVKTFGRVHELFLVGMYKFKTKNYFSDMELGWKMFRKGKMHLIPHKASSLSEVKEVFKQAKNK